MERESSVQPSPGFQLACLNRCFRRFFAGCLEELDLPGSAPSILVELDRCPGASQEQLTSSLALEKTHTAKLCRLLSDRGLIRREPDPADRRRYCLQLTPAGRDMLPVIRGYYKRWNALLSAPMTPDQQAQLQALLSAALRSAQDSGL